MTNTLDETISLIQLDLFDLDEKIKNYRNLFPKILSNKKELISFLRGLIQISFYDNFENKETTYYYCMNNLIENVLFTIEYECLYYLENGLYEALSSRTRKLFEQINDIVILKYYTELEDKNEYEYVISDLYYINFICKYINVATPKYKIDSEYIELRIHEAVENFFDKNENSYEFIKNKMKLILKEEPWKQNNFWFHEYTKKNKLTKNKNEICEKIIKEKLKKYLNGELKGNKKAIRKCLKNLYELYEMNKSRGNIFVHSNLSITYKEYKKVLGKKDINDIQASIKMIDGLLFILAICILENDNYKEIENIKRFIFMNVLYYFKIK